MLACYLLQNTFDSLDFECQLNIHQLESVFCKLNKLEKFCCENIFIFAIFYLDSRKKMCLRTCRYISFFVIGYMVKLLEKESQLKIMNKWQILFLSIAQIALDMKPTTIPALYIGKFSSTLAKVWIFVE